jgi:plastocyanin
VKTSLFASVLWLIGQSALAGTISGTVHAKGLPPTEIEAAGGAYQSKKYEFVERIDYDAMRDFVVYIEGPVAGTKPPSQPAKVEQKNAEFIPHVLPVMVGTTVEWPNEDTIFHNVFSKSQTKPFDLGLYRKGDQAKQVIFDKPGEVDVFCSIHAKMNCIILVLENPWFAATDAKGRYAITNVPAGSYKLVAWQERLFSKTREITVPETGEIKIDFTLGPDTK